ncbi:methyltransferase domain-containing protein [Streptomyces sp. NBC_00059]|uniref:class I SAM-dependent methyltransferase n=1 Tax=Streptomyces sp. NBC_00059 TaxID=2975635 RepID=UPI0022521CCA|nr:methyltransferase domain-containing protein [Streptomyces sp. NBC_00059]MCX5416002.1 methyltransferase domain-containing protein [Streptomyces sp. NBC_00059]
MTPDRTDEEPQSSSTVAEWTWEAEETDKPIRCRSLVESPGRAFGREQLRALGLEGIQFGSWDERSPLCLNTDRVGLASPETVTEPGRLYHVDDECYFISLDVRDPLPFADHTFEWVYAEHFVEHLSPAEGIQWLREVGRVLVPGGVVRLTTPDLRRYLQSYLQDDGFFAEHRRRLVRLGAPPQELPDRPAFWVNQIFQFHGHQWIYDHEELSYALRQAGFPANGVVDRPFREGAVPAMAMLDRAVRNDETLYVEARSDPA